MKSRGRWWLVFSACAAVVLLAMAWLTVVLLRLEEREFSAQRELAHQNDVRIALWRMDSWLAPVIAREAGRAADEYEPFLPPPRAYTKLLSEIAPGEVLTPSPLLAFRSPYIRLHFQIGPDGAITSPQVPSGNLRDLAEGGSFLTAAEVASCERVLETLRPRLSVPALEACVIAIDNHGWVAPDDAAGAADANALAPEYGRRQTVLQQAAQRNVIEADEVGLLTPVWLDDASDPALVFVRKTLRDGVSHLQGFLCEWPAIEVALSEEIVDLFPAPMLTPVREPGAARADMLASMPLALAAPATVPPPSAWLTPARATLAVSWLGVLAGLVAVGITLGASLRYGESRSRFASAVTHELRTPLTTFRMYSEMLANGMVPLPETRQTYLETLRDESDRLTRLVENVLAYSRIERGHAPARRVPVPVTTLLDGVEPELMRHAAAGGLSLEVDRACAGDVEVDVDEEAVRQILVNLVDNACKYAADAEDRRLHLAARVNGSKVEIALRDHGPGVEARQRARIFEPFDRGGRGPEDAAPGVGLGLALARSLARRQGGELRLAAPGAGGGAEFVLSLPKRR